MSPVISRVSSGQGINSLSGFRRAFLSRSGGGGANVADNFSLRFNSTDSASLTRSVTTKGNTKKFTFSCWVKRTKLGAFPHNLLSGSTGTDTGAYLCFPDNSSNALGTADSLVFKSDNAAGGGSVGTYSVFRDTSAWYHIVLAVDTQQASDSNKVKIYVNGVQEELQSTASPGFPTYDSELSINDVGKAAIGAELNDPYGTRFHGDFLLAEVHFIDGQQLTPSSFGAFDATTGVWDPIEVTGLTYGTNGFYLDFKDNSSTTSSSNEGIGKDVSGKGNYFTSNSISVTAGAGNDSLADHPTNGDTANDGGFGGEISGNYCTLSPVDKPQSDPIATLSNGNLQASTSAVWTQTRGTFYLRTGKWYFEYTIGAAGNATIVGFVGSEYNSGSGPRRAWQVNADVFKDDNANVSYGSGGASPGDVIGVKLDLDNGTIGFSKNGTDNGTADSDMLNDLPLSGWTPYLGLNGANGTVNFGQRAFEHPVSGYKAICTANLSNPAVADGSDVMDAQRWSGDSNNGRVISAYNFQPELVWIKNRNNSAGYNWIAVNSVRGAGKYLTMSANNTESTFGYVSAFNSNGFTLSNHTEVNASGNNYVGYSWDATGVSQSNYDPESTGAPVNYVGNTSAGFSIVECQSPNTTQARAHGCGGVPQFIMAKAYADSGEAWHIYHGALGKGYYGVMGNSAIAQNPFNSSDQWGSSDPTDSLFYVKAVTGSGANDAAGMIYFIWSAVEGYSSFGKYTGNGSFDGPMLNLGFKPSVILIKNAFVSNDWKLYDTARSRYNTTGIQQPVLYPSLSNNEDLNYGGDFLSNGYKIRDTNQALNTSGDTYLYCAWAENPFKTARAR